MRKLSDNLRRRIEDAVKQPFKEANKSLLVSLHGEAFSSNLCRTCEHEQILAYIQLTRLIKPKFKDMEKQIPNPPSKKYRINPRMSGQRFGIPRKRWLITDDTLTDEQGKYILDSGLWPECLIVTVKEAKDIREEMEGRPKAKKASSKK